MVVVKISILIYLKNNKSFLLTNFKMCNINLKSPIEDLTETLASIQK